MAIADLPSRPARATVGIIMSSFGDPYAGPLVAGIEDVMRENDVNVVCFAGGRPGSPHDYESGGSVLYDLVSGQNVDGLLFMSGTLVHFLGQELLEQFATRYHGIPLVTIAGELPERPSVLVDNEAGLRQVIEHLIDIHRHRRIGFIRGPQQSTEAENRYRVYRKVMAEKGLEIDASWVVPGAFDQVSGAAAARLLFEERKLELDAVVAGNDQMALAAVETLKLLGLDVPHDVAVVGFDDTELSGFVTPALTTVRQPLYQLGERAAQTLLAMLSGDDVDACVVLPTQAVIRESCGCSPKLAHAITLRPPSHDEAGGDWRARLADAGARIAAEMLQHVDSPALRPANWRDTLLAAMRDEVEGGDTFLPVLEDLLGRMSAVGEDVWPWQKVLVTLRTSIGPWLQGEARERGESAWHRAELLIADVSRRVQAQRRVRAERRARSLGQISQALISIIDLHELAAVVTRGLPQLQLRNCFVALYEDPTHPTAWSRLVLASTEQAPVDLAGQEPRFPSRLLVPPGTFPHERRYTLVVEALYFKEHQLGYVLFEVDAPEGSLFQEIRQQLSSALMRVKREAELKSLHLAERTRSAELEHAYQVMKDNQQKLLISEKMAALGRLTAGMAHEMNTPLAAVRMALEELNKLAAEYAGAVSDPSITAADHDEIAAEMRSAISLAIHAAEKVASFIHGIKFQTRDISRREHRSFNAVPVVQDTLVLLHHAMRKSNCTVKFEPLLPVVPVYGAPGRLAQVVTNLVSNAIDASRAKGGGEVVLSLRPDEARGEVELCVRDEGSGIPSEIVKRIFDPMFTTKPFGEGTGLGLSIVHDIVTSEFKGSIEVETEVGLGTTFTLRLQAGEGDRP